MVEFPDGSRRPFTTDDLGPFHLLFDFEVERRLVAFEAFVKSQITEEMVRDRGMGSALALLLYDLGLYMKGIIKEGEKYPFDDVEDEYHHEVGFRNLNAAAYD